jgi:hypothetical protein
LRRLIFLYELGYCRPGNGLAALESGERASGASQRVAARDADAPGAVIEGEDDLRAQAWPTWSLMVARSTPSKRPAARQRCS